MKPVHGPILTAATVAGLAIAHEASDVAPVPTASAGGATPEAGGTELYRAKQAGRKRVAWREHGQVAAGCGRPPVAP